MATKYVTPTVESPFYQMGRIYEVMHFEISGCICVAEERITGWVFISNGNYKTATISKYAVGDDDV